MFLDPRISLLVLASLVVSGSPLFGQDAESKDLATLRREDASIFEKSIACKHLAVVGTEAAVPVLAGLLKDEKLSHLARYALEPIPSPDVDRVFLASLSMLKGKNLVGVINSIANRGKAEAVTPLSKLMTDDDEQVAAAAAHAIARLGTPAAAELLEKSMSPQFAAACLVCGKTLAAQGNPNGAVQILSKTAKFTEAAEHIRQAAMLQVIHLEGANGQKMLADALDADDPDTFNMALRAARLLPEKTALPTVVKAIDNASPDRTTLLVTLLGDLGDPTGLAAVIRATESKNTAVRLAALQALGQLGTAAHVKLLIDAAIDGPTDVTDQALDTLAKLRGGGVDQTVLDLLNDRSRRPTVLRAIGRRRITSAVPKLLAHLNGANQLEVVAALGETVSLDELDVLAKLLSAQSPRLREAAQQAIHAASNRMPDRDAAAGKLSQYLTNETAEFVMRELSLLGGDKALEIVSDASEGDNSVLKDHATRALGEWLDISAAPALLKLAKADGDGKFGIRGIKGYIRLARQFSMPEKDRMEMCRTALETAPRATEKRLVFVVLRRHPSVEGLRIAVDASKNPALKRQAAQTARAIAPKVGQSEEVDKLLRQIDRDGN